MFNLKRNAVKIVTTTALSVALLTGVTAVHADALITHKMPSTQTFAQYVAEKTELTSIEKQALLDAEAKKQPLFDKINTLNEQIFATENKILKEANPLFDEIFALKDTHIHLVKKMDASINKVQASVKTYTEYINLSQVLTSDEKTILIEDHKKMDELYAKVDVYYKRADAATAGLKTQVQALREQVLAIDNENDLIWNKLYQ